MSPLDCSKIIKGKEWRLSRAELVDGFIARVNSIADIDEHTKAKRKFLNSKSCVLEPYVLIVGPSYDSVTDYYVVLYEGMFYKASSISHVFDLAFKILWAANLCYPQDGELCWYILQKCIYGLGDSTSVKACKDSPFTIAAERLIFNLNNTLMDYSAPNC